MFVEKTGSLLTVSYDKETPKTDTIDEILDIELPLHLGGPQLPEHFTDFKVPLVSSISWVILANYTDFKVPLVNSISWVILANYIADIFLLYVFFYKLTR